MTISRRVSSSAVAVRAMRGNLRVAFVQPRQLDVLGAEIVPPLRYAMRLVDGEQGQSAAGVEPVEQTAEPLAEQALRSHVEEVEFAPHQPPLGVDEGVEILRGVDEGGAHSGLQQGVDLILHERDQRRYDDADAGPQQRRNLITKRLAAAGRHQHQSVAAAANVVDDLRLLAAKFAVTENAL